MRVVVSGGAGFIGGHVVEQLVDAGHEVVVLDNLAPTVHPSPPDWLPAEVDLQVADVRDVDAWRTALRGADAVSHQAAKVGLGTSFADVSDYVAANDAGTAAMLLAMHRSRWRGRLVLVSSMVVYGEGRYVCERHGAVPAPPRRRVDLQAGRFDPMCPQCESPLTSEPVTEDTAPDPRNVYAATKLHQEHLCAAFGREAGLAVCVLRYHNVYGPRMPRDTPYAGVAAIFRSRLAAGESPLVFEDGAQRRDFVHVDDVAGVNVRALTTADPVDGVFNVASGSPCTLLEMAQLLCDAHGTGVQPVVTGSFRMGDVRHVVADAGRARRVLGFSARVAPEEGIPAFAAAAMRPVLTS